MPSSQTRVVVVKNAGRGEVCENHTDHTKDAVTSVPRASATTRRLGPADDEREADEQQRPDDVELLLDRQRPEVLDRGGRQVGREVVDLAPGEDPVDDVGRGRRDVDPHVAPAQPGHDEPRDHRGGDEHEHRGGQQPPDPPADEPQPRDRPARVQLGDEQPGDEEAGDDEEDVDADEPPAQRQAGVVGEHGEDGDRPQALDVGTEPRAPPRRPCGSPAGPLGRRRAARRWTLPASGRCARAAAPRQSEPRRRATRASRTSSGTRPETSPPQRATSLTSELDTCSRAGSHGRNTVSTPVRCRFIRAIGHS